MKLLIACTSALVLAATPLIAQDQGDGNEAANHGGPPVRVQAQQSNDDGALPDPVYALETDLLQGCPPSFEQDSDRCSPLGQNSQFGQRDDLYSRYSPGWWGLPDNGGKYLYDDGFLLRYEDDRISGYVPLLGGALSVGNPWPRGYGIDRLPDHPSGFYGLGNSYRYAANVVYRLDPETDTITSIAALLTGDEFVVGSPMPDGYDVYNVPYSYRDRYRDRPDAWYRFSDGYVYQIDPETRLVAAAIELLI